MKKLLIGSLLLNGILFGFFLFSSKDYPIADKEARYWHFKYEEMWKLADSLLPFYLTHFGQSVDIHKLLEEKSIEFIRGGEVLEAGPLTLKFGEHGKCVQAKIFKFADK